MSLEEIVGGITYEVDLDTRRLIDAEREVKRRLERIGDHGERLQATMTKVAAGVTAALSAIAVEGLVSKLIAVQRQFDVMFASLKTVTGGTSNAAAAFERLERFASTTPYSLDQAVKGFVKLKALGLDPSERAMTSFGNTASAMGKSLEQMIEAVADASTGEFERLKEFGIKARAEGDSVALTFQGTTTKVANNANAIVDYLARIGEVQFAGAMSERMRTLDGDISNLQDSVDGLFRAMSQSGAGDAIASGVRLLTEAIQEASTSIKEGDLTAYFDRLRPYIAAAEVAAVSLAGAIAGRLVAAFVTMASQAALATASIGAATLATRGFSAVIATLGGPIGIAVTALGLLALNWDKVAGQARDAAAISEDAAQRIAGALKKAPTRAAADLQAQLKDTNDELALIDRELRRTGANMADAGQLAELQQRRDVLVKVADDIRGAMDTLHGGAGRGKVNPDPVTPRAAPEPRKGSSGAKFDGAAYIAGLQADMANAVERIDIVEREALRRNAALLAEGKLTAQQAATARTLIEQRAAEERRDIQLSAAEDERRRIEDSGKANAEAAARAAVEQAQALDEARNIIVGDDYVQRLLLNLELQSKALLDAGSRDLANAKVYADARIKLERETNERIAQTQAEREAASVAMAARSAADLYGVLQQSGRERTGLAKAMFAVSKALAVAEIILNTEVAASKAGAQLGIYGIPLATMIRATGYASAGMVAGMAIGELASGGRQYGGGTDAGSLYRVNETGRPEMFTAANGAQYMLPTTRGEVTPADKLGTGGVTINVTNYAGAEIETSTRDDGRVIDIAVRRAKAELAGEVRANEGPFFNALRSSTNVRGAL